ncbi:hypothetical protein CC80DRAFT_66682 [Byssothecium circinans]|uniref:Uncharacterized protein n=1 Tax=Byssothecium circinans TaxID=147558 RepID=A0A6A5U1D1_9PLEO|nr:hypothetical protein CC80DRAFT_66682 [Byssothecium circinans]
MLYLAWLVGTASTFTYTGQSLFPSPPLPGCRGRDSGNSNTWQHDHTLRTRLLLPLHSAISTAIAIANLTTTPATRTQHPAPSSQHFYSVHTYLGVTLYSDSQRRLTPLQSRQQRTKERFTRSKYPGTSISRILYRSIPAPPPSTGTRRSHKLNMASPRPRPRPRQKKKKVPAYYYGQMTERSLKFYDGTYRVDGRGFLDDGGVYHVWDDVNDEKARAPTPPPTMPLDWEDEGSRSGSEGVRVDVDPAPVSPRQSLVPSGAAVCEVDAALTMPVSPRQTVVPSEVGHGEMDASQAPRKDTLIESTYTEEEKAQMKEGAVVDGKALEKKAEADGLAAGEGAGEDVLGGEKAEHAKQDKDSLSDVPSNLSAADTKTKSPTIKAKEKAPPKRKRGNSGEEDQQTDKPKSKAKGAKKGKAGIAHPVTKGRGKTTATKPKPKPPSGERVTRGRGRGKTLAATASGTGGEARGGSTTIVTRRMTRNSTGG